MSLCVMIDDGAALSPVDSPPLKRLNIIMTFVLLSSSANYVELHHDKAL